MPVLIPETRAEVSPTVPVVSAESIRVWCLRLHTLVSGVLIAHPNETEVHMWSAVRGVGEEERGGVKRRIDSGERETGGALREGMGEEE